MGVQVQASAQMPGWLPKSRLLRDLPGRQFGSCDRQAQQGQFAHGQFALVTAKRNRLHPSSVTLLVFFFCGFLRPATRRPSQWRSLLGSRLIQHQQTISSADFGRLGAAVAAALAVWASLCRLCRGLRRCRGRRGLRDVLRRLPARHPPSFAAKLLGSSRRAQFVKKKMLSV